MHTLLRADLLAKRRDAGVSNERGVERVHAVPRCVSCMCAMQNPTPLSCQQQARRQGEGENVGVRLSEIFH